MGRRSLTCSVWRDSRLGGTAHGEAAGCCQLGGCTGPGRSFLHLRLPRRPPFPPPPTKENKHKNNKQAGIQDDGIALPRKRRARACANIAHGHAQKMRPWHAAWLGGQGACFPRGSLGSGWVERWSTYAHEHTQIIQINSTTGSGRRAVTAGENQHAPPPLPPAPSLHQPSHRGIPLR